MKISKRHALVPVAAAALVAGTVAPSVAGAEWPANTYMNWGAGCADAIGSHTWVSARVVVSVSDACTDGYRALAKVQKYQNGAWTNVTATQLWDTYNDDNTTVYDLSGSVSKGQSVRFASCTYDYDASTLIECGRYGAGYDWKTFTATD